MDHEIIKVGMADLKVSRPSVILTTLGLGSCVGIALYDIVTRNSGLAHIMLPDSRLLRNNDNTAKFADTAITEMIGRLIRLGSLKNNLIAKIAGGASMFSYTQRVNELMNIGERNIEHTIHFLKENKIPIISMDVGKDYGRTVELNSSTGIFRIKTINHGIKEI